MAHIWVRLFFIVESSPTLIFVLLRLSGPQLGMMTANCVILASTHNYIMRVAESVRGRVLFCLNLGLELRMWLCIGFPVVFGRVEHVFKVLPLSITSILWGVNGSYTISLIGQPNSCGHSLILGETRYIGSVVLVMMQEIVLSKSVDHVKSLPLLSLVCSHIHISVGCLIRLLWRLIVWVVDQKKGSVRGGRLGSGFSNIHGCSFSHGRSCRCTYGIIV